MFFARPTRAFGLMGLIATSAFGGGDAIAQQQVYRIVGPDGRITFSDKAPLETSAKAAVAPTVQLPATGAGTLPFELRQVASRYPVTLYSAPGCGPCGAGRALLSSRGVPFTEKTVTTSDDIDALRRIAGAASLPFLTVGGQQIKGFSEVEWVQFLDAAGYPQTSQLPASYNQPPATPLVAAQEAPRPAARGPNAAPQAPSAEAPQPAPPPNPAGIRF